MTDNEAVCVQAERILAGGPTPVERSCWWNAVRRSKPCKPLLWWLPSHKKKKEWKALNFSDFDNEAMTTLYRRLNATADELCTTTMRGAGTTGEDEQVRQWRRAHPRTWSCSTEPPRRGAAEQWVRGGGKRSRCGSTFGPRSADRETSRRKRSCPVMQHPPVGQPEGQVLLAGSRSLRDHTSFAAPSQSTRGEPRSGARAQLAAR